MKLWVIKLCPPTQVGVSLLFRGDHQAAIVRREGDGQAHVLLLRPRHVTNHRQQADGVRVAGQAEAVDLEPAGERQTGHRRETSALCRTSFTSFRATELRRRKKGQRQSQLTSSDPASRYGVGRHSFDGGQRGQQKAAARKRKTFFLNLAKIRLREPLTWTGTHPYPLSLMLNSTKAGEEETLWGRKVRGVVMDTRLIIWWTGIAEPTGALKLLVDCNRLKVRLKVLVGSWDLVPGSTAVLRPALKQYLNSDFVLVLVRDDKWEAFTYLLSSQPDLEVDSPVAVAWWIFSTRTLEGGLDTRRFCRRTNSTQGKDVVAHTVLVDGSHFTSFTTLFHKSSIS